MRRFQNLYDQAWQLLPAAWYRLHQESVKAHAGTDEARASIDAVAKRPEKDYWGDALGKMTMAGTTAIIPIEREIVKGARGSDKYYMGYTAHEDIAEDIDAAVMAGAKAMMFAVNSPGGTAMGNAELGAKIAGLRARGIRTGAFTSDLCCSAAYYLAAGCEQIFCTASAMVGSIGTIWETMNVAGWLEEMGIEYTVFTSGKYKGTGHPATRLSEEQRSYMQGMVDLLSSEFKGHVTRHRKVAEGAMEGQVFTGDQATKNGLVDGTVQDFAEAMALLS